MARGGQCALPFNSLSNAQGQVGRFVLKPPQGNSYFIFTARWGQRALPQIRGHGALRTARSTANKRPWRVGDNAPYLSIPFRMPRGRVGRLVLKPPHEISFSFSPARWDSAPYLSPIESYRKGLSSSRRKKFYPPIRCDPVFIRFFG